MEALRPNALRAKRAITWIWIMLVVEVLSLISSYFQYDLLQPALHGGIIPIEKAEANDLREQAIAFIYVVVFIMSAITFIQWFRRAYYNLHQKVSGLSYSEGWAAGAWFVPLINLHRPFAIMKELYEETKKLLINRRLELPENLYKDLVGVWWTLWIVNLFVSNYVFRSSMKSDTLDQIADTTIANMVSSVLSILLSIIAVKVIRDYAKMESVLIGLKEPEEDDSEQQDDGLETAW